MRENWRKFLKEKCVFLCLHFSGEVLLQVCCRVLRDELILNILGILLCHRAIIYHWECGILYEEVAYFIWNDGRNIKSVLCHVRMLCSQRPFISFLCKVGSVSCPYGILFAIVWNELNFLIFSPCISLQFRSTEEAKYELSFWLAGKKGLIMNQECFFPRNLGSASINFPCYPLNFSSKSDITGWNITV